MPPSDEDYIRPGSEDSGNALDSRFAASAALPAQVSSSSRVASGGHTARGAAEGEAAGILDQGHRLLVHADRVHLQQEPGRRLGAPF